ncbi:LysM peptidoglycan-binding domain-containing protein [Candidatus Saccharibacteria bacterium]|nr:LysM peptidoglycan-binding domain-containing protein [Candidatus Saccharibacteria bacterium]
MTKKEKKEKTTKKAHFKTIRRAFPYVLISAAIISVAFFGSKDKFEDKETSIDMRVLAANNFAASADQTAEMYIISEVAKSMNSPTAAVIATNYDSITSASAVVSVKSEKIDKPNIVDTSHLAVGVVEYIVSPGETIASIAQKYSASGVDETMIRWSNGFKANVQVSPGQKIYVPGRAGFVYTVKNGETVNTIAQKYKSSIEDIVAANSLELDSNLVGGMKILIPNGELPDYERPDYVAPATRRGGGGGVSYSYRAQYSAGNRYAYGWCTWYAWSRRPDLPGNMGNARSWANNARNAGFPVDKSPRAGDVFQTGSGYYGHVGYVESVNGDGTITVSDMNYNGRWGRVTVRNVDSGEWRSWNFIHRR